MKFNREEDIIIIFGWSVGSKMNYLMKKLNNQSEEELYEEVVVNNKLMKTKSFHSYITKINRLRDDIRFV